MRLHRRLFFFYLARSHAPNCSCINWLMKSIASAQLRTLLNFDSRLVEVDARQTLCSLEEEQEENSLLFGLGAPRNTRIGKTAATFRQVNREIEDFYAAAVPAESLARARRSTARLCHRCRHLKFTYENLWDTFCETRKISRPRIYNWQVASNYLYVNHSKNIARIYAMSFLP